MPTIAVTKIAADEAQLFVDAIERDGFGREDPKLYIIRGSDFIGVSTTVVQGLKFDTWAQFKDYLEKWSGIFDLFIAIDEGDRLKIVHWSSATYDYIELDTLGTKVFGANAEPMRFYLKQNNDVLTAYRIVHQRLCATDGVIDTFTVKAGGVPTDDLIQSFAVH